MECRSAAGQRDEDVIPVVLGRTKTEYSGIESNHLLSHRVAGRVGIEAAVDAPLQKWRGQLVQVNYRTECHQTSGAP